MHPHLLLHHLRRLAPQHVHLHVALDRAKIQFDVPAFAGQVASSAPRVAPRHRAASSPAPGRRHEARLHDLDPQLAHPHHVADLSHMSASPIHVGPRRLGPVHDVVLDAPGPPAAEVALPPLVHPERPIDASSRQLRQPEIRGETAVPEHHVPRLQGVQHLRGTGPSRPSPSPCRGPWPDREPGPCQSEIKTARRAIGNPRPRFLARRLREGRLVRRACPASRPSCRRRGRLADRSRARFGRLGLAPAGRLVDQPADDGRG